MNHKDFIQHKMRIIILYNEYYNVKGWLPMAMAYLCHAHGGDAMPWLCLWHSHRLIISLWLRHRLIIAAMA